MGHCSSLLLTYSCSLQMVGLLLSAMTGGAMALIFLMQLRGLSLWGRPVVCGAFLGLPPFWIDSNCWHTLQLPSMCSHHPTNTDVLCSYSDESAFLSTVLQEYWGWIVGLSCVMSTDFRLLSRFVQRYLVSSPLWVLTCHRPCITFPRRQHVPSTVFRLLLALEKNRQVTLCGPGCRATMSVWVEPSGNTKKTLWPGYYEFWPQHSLGFSIVGRCKSVPYACAVKFVSGYYCALSL